MAVLRTNGCGCVCAGGGGVGGGWKCLSLPFGEGIQCVEAVLVPWWSTKTGNVTFVDGEYIFIRSTH